MNIEATLSTSKDLRPLGYTTDSTPGPTFGQIRIGWLCSYVELLPEISLDAIERLLLR